MIWSQSRTGRRLVGRLDRGASLHEALLDVCRSQKVRSGEIRATGAFETVELAEFDQAAQAWKAARSLGGGFEVLSLLGSVAEQNGQLALNLRATLMRDRDNGLEILGGHVVRARVFALEVVIETFDDLVIRRGRDPATGLVVWTQAIGSEPPAAPSPLPMATPSLSPSSQSDTTWAEVARASQAAPVAPSAGSDGGSDEDEGDEAVDDALEPGDILIHPTFGRCDVQRIEGGYEFAQVRLKNGRLVRLSLDILKVVRSGTEGGHRVWRAKLDD